ncbi:MAG: flagellin modification protein PseA [Bacteroidota bacterium]
MKTCIKCGMPDTRPGSNFQDGVCLACRNYENRKSIDWSERKKTLKEICEKRISEKGEYDCICPVSGGKDSTVIVSELIKLGMRPLLVTVTDEFTHTQAGLHNVKNIAERFNLDHIIFRHSPQTFKKETLQDLENELHPLKWIEEKIYSTPVKIAKLYKIPLVFFGENSAYEYGSSSTLDLLHFLSDDDTKVYYFFAFFTYNERETMEKAKKYGFKDLDDFNEWFRQGNVENFTQIDSIAYIIQLWTKFPKFGFQRVSDITSRMVRKGQITKQQADLLIKEKDYICDPAAKRDFCNTLGITEKYFDEIVDKHANKDIVVKDVNGNWRRKDLFQNS